MFDLGTCVLCGYSPPFFDLAMSVKSVMVTISVRFDVSVSVSVSASVSVSVSVSVCIKR